MTAAKLLMSLVTSAVATEKAAISVAKSASTTPRASIPSQCIWNPTATPMATTTASKTNIIMSPERIGPMRMANRLAGVTRKRSMTPDWSSKMVPKPMLAPLANASRARIPGRNTSSTLPLRTPMPVAMCLSRGVNKREVEHGRREAHEKPDRIAQHLASCSAGTAAPCHGPSSCRRLHGAHAGVAERTAGLAQKTSSRVGSERLMDLSPMCSPSRRRSRSGSAGAPVLDVEAQLVSLVGDLTYVAPGRRSALLLRHRPMSSS